MVVNILSHFVTSHIPEGPRGIFSTAYARIGEDVLRESGTTVKLPDPGDVPTDPFHQVSTFVKLAQLPSDPSKHEVTGRC